MLVDNDQVKFKFVSAAAFYDITHMLHHLTLETAMYSGCTPFKFYFLIWTFSKLTYRFILASYSIFFERTHTRHFKMIVICMRNVSHPNTSIHIVMTQHHQQLQIVKLILLIALQHDTATISSSGTASVFLFWVTSRVIMSRTASEGHCGFGGAQLLSVIRWFLLYVITPPHTAHYFSVISKQISIIDDRQRCLAVSTMWANQSTHHLAVDTTWQRETESGPQHTLEALVANRSGQNWRLHLKICTYFTWYFSFMRGFDYFIQRRPGAWMLGDSAIHLIFITVNDMEKQWMFDWCLPQHTITKNSWR